MICSPVWGRDSQVGNYCSKVSLQWHLSLCTVFNGLRKDDDVKLSFLVNGSRLFPVLPSGAIISHLASAKVVKVFLCLDTIQKFLLMSYLD